MEESTNTGFQYFSLIRIFLHLNKKVEEDFLWRITISESINNKESDKES